MSLQIRIGPASQRGVDKSGQHTDKYNVPRFTTGIQGPGPTWTQKMNVLTCNPTLHLAVFAASPQTQRRLRRLHAGVEAAGAGPFPGAFLRWGRVGLGPRIPPIPVWTPS